MATERQKKYLELYKKHGSYAEVGRICGVGRSTVKRSLDSLKKKQARHGVAENCTPVPNLPGFSTTKTTIHTVGDKIVQEWRRQRPEQINVEEWLQALEDHVPQPKFPEYEPESYGDKLLVIPIGDLHLGMHAWGKESGDDYDLHIASYILKKGVEYQLAQVDEDIGQILLIDLGDFIHTDFRSNETEMSKHNLSVDTRWPKIIHESAEALLSVIEMCATVAPTEVYVAPGNHNWHSAHWMQLLLDIYYKGHGGVRVIRTPKKRMYYQFGDNLFGVTHGEKPSAQVLATNMADDARELWGETYFHHWFCGHIHKSKRMQKLGTVCDEAPSCTVEYFPTLAPRDGWTYDSGYHAQRILQGIIYDPEFGEIQRRTFNARRLPGMCN